MKKLEEVLDQVKTKKEEKIPVTEKPIYKGLKLVEDKPYSGGTSIKYWM